MTTPMSNTRFILTIAYLTLFLITLSTISATLYFYPLFPLQTDSLEWSNTWLMTTVVDYYGSTLCLCGIIWATSTSWVGGLAWTAGCCLLGSPVCCAWILYQIVVKQRSLGLAGNDNGNTGERNQLLSRRIS